MELTLSPQIKIVVLVGAVLALALGGSMMLLGRSHDGSAAPAATPSVAVTTTAAPTPAAAKTAPAAPAAPKAKAPGTSHAARPKARPEPKPPVAPNGLPTPLDELLHTHRVVVVALYNGEVASDKIARDEAHAGAVDSGAGFLGVNVLNERVSAPLTAIAGNGTLLPAPGILVYKRPGTLMNRLDGFADRVAVAEAVANALLAQAAPVPAAGTAASPAATVPGTPVPSPLP